MIKEKFKQWKEDRKRLSDIDRKKKEAYYNSLEEEAPAMGKIQAQLEKSHRAKLYDRKLENLRDELEIKDHKKLEKLKENDSVINMFGLNREKDNSEKDMFGLNKKEHKDFDGEKEETFDIFERHIQ